MILIFVYFEKRSNLDLRRVRAIRGKQSVNSPWSLMDSNMHLVLMLSTFIYSILH